MITICMLYAMAMKKVDTIVGHVPQTISLLCNLFLSAGGTISCNVIGVRKYSDLTQRGLDIPCKLTFQGEQTMIEEIRNLLPKRPKDPPSTVMKSSLVQKSFEKGTMEKQAIKEETVKKPRLEACLPPQGISVAT